MHKILPRNGTPLCLNFSGHDETRDLLQTVRGGCGKCHRRPS